MPMSMDIIYTDLGHSIRLIKERQVHPNYNVLCIISVKSGETPNNLLGHRKIARSQFLSYSWVTKPKS